MRAAVLLPLVVCGLAAAYATNAQVECNNPPGAQYLAQMTPDKNAGIDAEIVAQTGSDGCAYFTVNVNGKAFYDGSPYLYHIHDQPVPSDGNCTATLGHLDPYKRGDDPPCDASMPQTCQVGDLSGKHGKIPYLPGFSAKYTDKFVSLSSGSPAFLGDRSVVIHYSNKTRIACANFELVQPTNSSANINTSSQSLTTITSTLSSPASGPPSLTTLTSTLDNNGGGINLGFTTIGGQHPSLTTITSTSSGSEPTSSPGSADTTTTAQTTSTSTSTSIQTANAAVKTGMDMPAAVLAFALAAVAL